MLNPDEIPENWSASARAYESAFEALTSQFALDVLLKLRLAEGSDVLDVAAGTGAFSLHAALAGARVFATDFAPGMIVRLRERAASDGLSVTAEVMDGQALRVPDASFDVSVSVLGVTFFPDIQKGVDELRRVLRPGGRTAIVCLDEPSNLEVISLVARAIRIVFPDFSTTHDISEWARLAGADLLRTVMLVAGFANVEVTKVTRSFTIASPEHFWTDFARSIPQVTHILSSFTESETARIGQAYMALLSGASARAHCVRADVCIGIGRV